MKKLLEKKWEYTLYKSEEFYILSVICGSSAIYELNIPLSDLEVKEFLNDENYLGKLASEISKNPAKYSSRNISI